MNANMEVDADILDDFSDFSDSQEAEEEQPIVCESEPKQPEPEYSTQELNDLLGFVQKMTILSGIQDAEWSEECKEVITTWFLNTEHLMLSIYYDSNDKLAASLSYPTEPIFELMFFLREPNHIFSLDNFHDDVTFGRIDDDIDGSLLLLMERIYAPIFFRKTDWSDTIKAHFCESLYSFLANMTALHYKLSGLTVLYVPHECLNVSVDEAACDKALVKRLELVAEHWVAQLHMGLNDTEQVAPYALLCPADEFNFWTYRLEMLFGLHHQTGHKDFLHILGILRTSQSTFVKPIEEMIANTLREIERAKDNAVYLRLLIRPCEELSNVDEAADVPLKLPKIINIIRYIWLHSSFYNTELLITKLFRFVGNQIIRFYQCKIDVVDILAGKPGLGMKLAHLAIDCCLYYKIIFEKISSQPENQQHTVGWNLDSAMIFNHIDAFIRRLRDLAEICEGIVVFGTGNETEDTIKLTFGGDRGDEFEQTCIEIEKQFKSGLSKIRNASSSMLNVHDNNWHEHISAYRGMIDRLEKIVDNLIVNVFGQISNAEDGIYALACLHRFSTRANLRPAYERQVAAVWQMFGTEISKTNDELVQALDERLIWLPKLAGRAVLLRTNRDRIMRLRSLFEKAHWLPTSAESEKILANCAEMISTTNRNIQKLFDEWIQSLGVEVAARINRTLITRSVVYPGLFECNFERSIFEMFHEAQYFKSLGFGFPVHINQFFAKETSLKFAYDGIVELLLAYNKILASISDKERLLMRPLIQTCDRCLLPGAHKLRWTSDSLDTFIVDCNKCIRDLKDFTEIYRKANIVAVQSCQQLSEVVIVHIPVKQADKLENIEKHLNLDRNTRILEIVNHHNTIMRMLSLVFTGLEMHIKTIEVHWSEYVQKFDNLVEKALTLCVRDSLKSVHSTLSGNGIIGPAILLQMSVMICDKKMTLTPKMRQISDFFGNIYLILAKSIRLLPRLTERFRLSSHVQLTYSEVIENDSECKSIQALILCEIKRNQREMLSYIEQWTPFAPIWQLDRDAFMLKFKTFENVSATKFDTNIQQFIEISNQIAIRGTSSNVNFMAVNVRQLRRFILMEIEEWQNEYLHLMEQIAREKLTDFFAYTNENAKVVVEDPNSVDDLHRCSAVYEKLTSEVDKWQSVLADLQQYFDVLEKYGVSIDGEFGDMKAEMTEHWNKYLNALKEADEILWNAKQRFKLKLQTTKSSDK